MSEDTFAKSGIVWPKFNPPEKPKDTRCNYAQYLAGRSFHTSSLYEKPTYAANVKMWGFRWPEGYETTAFESQEIGDWYHFQFPDLRANFAENHPGWSAQFGGRSGGWLELVDSRGRGYFADYNVEDRQDDRLAEVLNYESSVWAGELTIAIDQAAHDAEQKWWKTNYVTGEIPMDIRSWERRLAELNKLEVSSPIRGMEILSRALAQWASHGRQYRDQMERQAEQQYRRTHPHPGTKNQWLAYSRADLREEFNLVWEFFEFAEECCQDFAYYVWDRVNNE